MGALRRQAVILAVLTAGLWSACSPKARALHDGVRDRVVLRERAPAEPRTIRPVAPEIDRTPLHVPPPHRDPTGLVVEEIHGEHVRVIHRFLTEVPVGDPFGVCSSFDLDGDGVPEGLWVRRVREEWDHDGDGRIDEVFHFDDRGELEAWDQNGDGVVDHDWRQTPPVPPTRHLSG